MPVPSVQGTVASTVWPPVQGGRRDLPIKIVREARLDVPVKRAHVLRRVPITTRLIAVAAGCSGKTLAKGAAADPGRVVQQPLDGVGIQGCHNRRRCY